MRLISSTHLLTALLLFGAGPIPNTDQKIYQALSKDTFLQDRATITQVTYVQGLFDALLHAGRQGMLGKPLSNCLAKHKIVATPIGVNIRFQEYLSENHADQNLSAVMLQLLKDGCAGAMAGDKAITK